MNLADGGQDECPEMSQGKDGDVVVILLPLIVVIVVQQEVSLFVKGAGLVSKSEMVLS